MNINNNKEYLINPKNFKNLIISEIIEGNQIYIEEIIYTQFTQKEYFKKLFSFKLEKENPKDIILKRSYSMNFSNSDIFNGQNSINLNPEERSNFIPEYLNNIDNVNNNNYIESKLYLGRNLLILYDLNKNIIIFCFYRGYSCKEYKIDKYHLNIEFVMKFTKLEIDYIEEEIKNIKKYKEGITYNLRKYILEKNNIVFHQNKFIIEDKIKKIKINLYVDEELKKELNHKLKNIQKKGINRANSSIASLFFGNKYDKNKYKDINDFIKENKDLSKSYNYIIRNNSMDNNNSIRNDSINNNNINIINFLEQNQNIISNNEYSINENNNQTEENNNKDNIREVNNSLNGSDNRNIIYTNQGDESLNIEIPQNNENNEQIRENNIDDEEENEQNNNNIQQNMENYERNEDNIRINEEENEQDEEENRQNEEENEQNEEENEQNEEENRQNEEENRQKEEENRQNEEENRQNEEENRQNEENERIDERIRENNEQNFGQNNIEIPNNNINLFRNNQNNLNNINPQFPYLNNQNMGTNGIQYQYYPNYNNYDRPYDNYYNNNLGIIPGIYTTNSNMNNNNNNRYFHNNSGGIANMGDSYGPNNYYSDRNNVEIKINFFFIR